MTTNERHYLRFPRAYRIEHWVVVLSFTTLAVTGLVQKYALASISLAIINLLGGIESVRMLHRIAATVLMIEAVYHIGLISYNLIVRRYGAELMPGKQDLVNALHAFKYNLGLRKDRPKQGRYTFEEKFEYFAIIWGTLVMIVTGFILWNPIASTQALPGEFVPAAKVIHSGEALLAVLAILIWHFYHVHLRSFNKSMFTGKMSEEEMREEHPLELEALQQGDSAAPKADTDYPRRRRRFLAAYSVIATLLLVGIYVFVTFEQTALETVTPVESVVAYTPPEAPAAPLLVSFDSPMTSWENGVGAFFAARCTLCHGSRVPLAGLDLTNYDAALLGGSDVPAIVPNRASDSGIVQRHSGGNHPATMTQQELEKIEAWINAGAPR